MPTVTRLLAKCVPRIPQPHFSKKCLAKEVGEGLIVQSMGKSLVDDTGPCHGGKPDPQWPGLQQTPYCGQCWGVVRGDQSSDLLPSQIKVFNVDVEPHCIYARSDFVKESF